MTDPRRVLRVDWPWFTAGGFGTLHGAVDAPPGCVDALERAISTCDEPFLPRSGGTAEGRIELAAKRGQLLGRLTRLRAWPSGELDEDGNPIPVRRHPAEPRRTRARQFAVR